MIVLENHFHLFGVFLYCFYFAMWQNTSLFQYPIVCDVAGYNSSRFRGNIWPY